MSLARSCQGEDLLKRDVGIWVPSGTSRSPSSPMQIAGRTQVLSPSCFTAIWLSHFKCWRPAEHVSMHSLPSGVRESLFV